ncbi:hypothetical protein ALP71_200083 [Pseudomonas coronafaciens pv. garcae]|nr:hypothetical protein ALP71_200083 [Pseudomonas coronafaciens pv. garcae]
MPAKTLLRHLAIAIDARCSPCPILEKLSVSSFRSLIADCGCPNAHIFDIYNTDLGHLASTTRPIICQSSSISIVL